MGCSCQMCPDEPLYAADPRGQQISQMPAHIAASQFLPFTSAWRPSQPHPADQPGVTFQRPERDTV
jgi:hypothetical protein